MVQFCVLLTTRDPKLKRARREMAGFYAPRRIATAVLIGVGSRRRSASQAINLPSDGGINLGDLFTVREMERHPKRVNRNCLALLEERSKSKEMVAGRS